jgi:predicted PurR-regulated permease PerM
MELIYFTVAAIALYVISDQIVNLIERKRGERLQHRSLLFFAIILTLAVITFNAIQYFSRGVEPENNATPAPATIATDKAR